MRSLVSADFSGLTLVTPNVIEFLLSCYTLSRLPRPVYFYSIIELICKWKSYAVIIEGCLVVFRVSRMYGNNSCIVYFSPISMSNDVKSEKMVVAMLLKAGFSIRLTASEVNRLGLNLRASKAKKDAGSPEFIYSIKDTLEMNGKKYKAIRNAVHRFDSRGGTVKYEYDPRVSDIVLDWAKKKGLNYKKYLGFLETQVTDGLIYFTTIYVDGVVQGFTLMEKLGDYYASSLGVNNHDSEFDLVPALHYYSVFNLPTKDTYFTTGAGRFPGLAVQKRRLQPFLEEAIYRIPALVQSAHAYDLVKEFL